MFTANQLRKFHRTLSFFTALPLIVITVTGILMALRQEFTWISPKSIKRERVTLAEVISPQEIYQRFTTTSLKNLLDLKDLDNLQFKPKSGVYTLRVTGDKEMVIEAKTGNVLSFQKKRSLWILRIHEGTWSSWPLREWIYVPAALGLVLLWLTGMGMLFRGKTLKTVMKNLF